MLGGSSRSRLPRWSSSGNGTHGRHGRPPRSPRCVESTTRRSDGRASLIVSLRSAGAGTGWPSYGRASTSRSLFGDLGGLVAACASHRVRSRGARAFVVTNKRGDVGLATTRRSSWSPHRSMGRWRPIASSRASTRRLLDGIASVTWSSLWAPCCGLVDGGYRGYGSMVAVWIGASGQWEAWRCTLMSWLKQRESCSSVIFTVTARRP